MRKKTISVLIPCFNEEENVLPMGHALLNLFHERLPEYNYEIIFIDNDSTDRTRPRLRQLCRENANIKAILNAKNFGQFRSPYYGLMQTTGDCTIMLCCDFQDPIDRIPDMIAEWEAGSRIVVMQKTSSDENRILYFLRGCYYKAIRRFSEVEQIEHFTGFGLYDRTFVDVLRNLHDPTPFLRGVVAELGYRVKVLPYHQQARRAGKTHNNFFTLYDAAMLSVTSYTKVGLRLATFLGFFTGVISIAIGLIYLVMKLVYWDQFVAGMAPLLIGMFFLGAVILVFMGIMGEYILTMNQRLMNRPLVIEEERINFQTASPRTEPENPEETADLCTNTCEENFT